MENEVIICTDGKSEIIGEIIGTVIIDFDLYYVVLLHDISKTIGSTVLCDRSGNIY